MIFAIARNKEVPEFAISDFEIAGNIVDTCLGYMASLVSGGISETPYEDSQQKVLAFIKEHESGATATDIHQKFKSIKLKDRRDMLVDMESQELIRVEKMIGKTRPVYIYKAR